MTHVQEMEEMLGRVLDKKLSIMFDKFFNQFIGPIYIRLDALERKIDSHTEILKQQSEILKHHGEILKHHSEILEHHDEMLKNHGEMLEQLMTQKYHREDESLVNAHRLQRLETWGVKVGKKIDLKLEL